VRTGPQANTWSTLCAAKPTASLSQALQRTVPQSLDANVFPFGLSANGTTLYASVRTAGFKGIAAITLATWTVREAQAFASPHDGAFESGEGPWIAWSEFYSASDQSDYTVYAWDSVTGQLRTLGHSLRGPDGWWPSPWSAPAVSGHYAAWPVGDGPGPVDKLMLADLATGRERAIYQGDALQPFFDGGLLVWPASARPGGPTTLRAASVTSGRPAVLPAALQGVGVHASEITSSSGRTAYIIGPEYSKLYYSPSPSEPARVVLTLPAGEQFAAIEMGQGWLAWTTTTATYLASTRTGSYVQVTPIYGLAAGQGSGVVAISDYAGKSQPAHSSLHLLDFARLAWPSC
jgi:hypothetical protein